jgi:hypothetical protein
MRRQLLGHEGHARRFGGVQQVPAFAVLAVARQFVEAGAAPHIGGHAPVGFQQLLGFLAFAQDGAAAQQVDRWRLLGAPSSSRYMPLMICSSVPGFRPGIG